MPLKKWETQLQLTDGVKQQKQLFGWLVSPTPLPQIFQWMYLSLKP